MLTAQVYINQDFSGNFPPIGWTVDTHNQNWHAGEGNNAGGTPPEAYSIGIRNSREHRG